MLTQYPQVENTSQLLTFGLAILFGGILCFVYDCYRSLLLYLTTRSLMKHCADIVYCVLCAVACFCFLLVECRGEIRIYALGGFAMGFFLIRKFCSKYIRKVTTKIYKVITTVFGALIHPIIRIFLWCYKKILPILSKPPKTLQLFSKKKEKTLANDGIIDV